VGVLAEQSAGATYRVSSHPRRSLRQQVTSSEMELPAVKARIARPRFEFFDEQAAGDILSLIVPFLRFPTWQIDYGSEIRKSFGLRR